MEDSASGGEVVEDSASGGDSIVIPAPTMCASEAFSPKSVVCFEVYAR